VDAARSWKGRAASFSHFRGQVARHFHAHADFTNLRSRPCHDLVPYFACGREPSYVRSGQEPERRTKISWRAKDRQINFLRGAVRCDPSQADRDIAAACSSSMVFVKPSRNVWASFTGATVPQQADQIGEGLGVGVGDLSLSICGQPAGRSSSKGLLGQLLRGIRGADPWIEARTQSGPRRKHSARYPSPHRFVGHIQTALGGQISAARRMDLTRAT
jgi:hypothetical protein